MGRFAAQRRGLGSVRTRPATTKPMDLYSKPKIDYLGSIFSNSLEMTLGVRGFRSCIIRMNTGHKQAEFFRGGILARDNIHDASLVNDRDPVGERQDLIEIFRDKHDGCTFAPFGQQLLTYIFGRADIQAAGGLGSQDDTRIA